MAITIIIPSEKAEQLIKYVKKYKDNKDDLVILNSQSISSTLDETIEKSENDHILLFHPGFKSFSRNYMWRMKKAFTGNNFVICDSFKNDSISKNSAILFNRQHYKNDQRKIFDIISVQRKIYSVFSSEKIATIDNTEEPIKKSTKVSNEENQAKPNRKNQVRSSRGIDKKAQKASKRNENRENSQNVHLQITANRKPKILMIADVIGWAWWIKAEYLKQQLSAYYDIDIINIVGRNKQKVNPNKYDLYFTFGYSYVSEILKVPFKRRITGLTAHRPNQLLERRMKKIYATHANSVLLYRELEKMHNFPFYIPNGVDTNLFYEKTPVLSDHDVPIFGHVGKKGKMKNQSTIIEPAVKKANVKYYPHYNDYTNKIPHDKMVDVHHNYDVKIIASSEDGTSNPFLEASICGRMTIGNKIGNLPELITHMENGILLDKLNIDDYVDAIKWCQNNPDKVYEMGQNAKKEAENHWTWEEQCKNYKFMIDRILGIERDWSEYENPAIYHMNNYIKS